MKTKKLLVYALFVFLPILFASCEQEPVTDIGFIEKELKEVVAENGITRCSVHVLYGEQDYCEHRDVEFRIERGFLIVDYDHYNLLYLSKYMSSGNYISFFFADTKF